MRQLLLILVACGAALATIPGARAQTGGFRVVCKDGTIVPGSASSTACETHGGPAKIIAGAAPQDAGASAPPMPPSSQVWAATGSNLYYCPGDARYAASRRGSYMDEAAARRSGLKPGRGRVCAS